MATVVIMPRNGQSVESCVITAWNKKVGDEVHVGDILFSYETDKSSFDEEAKTDGTLLAVFYEEYDDVPCLNEVCVIGTPGEDISMFGKNGGAAPAAPAAEEAPAPAPAPAEAPKAAEPAAEAPAPAATEGPASGVSPRARHTAERLKVDLAGVTPTGPDGRIIERDVLAAAKSTSGALAAGSTAGIAGTGIGGRVTTSDLESGIAAAPEAPKAAPAAAAAPGSLEEAALAKTTGFRDEKMPRMRQIIGKSMRKSLNEIPQLTHMDSYDTTAVAAYRAQLKAAPESLGLPKITFNDIVLYAVSRIVRNYPELNANTLDDTTMRYFDHVHLGFAVDTPRGLLVPTIFNADTKSLAQISKEAKALAAAAQEGSLSPDLLSGASFTISNVGSVGVEYFTPVINPPQTGILGVGRMTDRIKVVDGQVVPYKAMGLSITFDHQALDGALAAKFLMELKSALENFTALLAE